MPSLSHSLTLFRLLLLSLIALALGSVLPPGWNPECKESEGNYTGSYLILAPKVIRPGLPYAVSVSLLKEFPDPLIVSVSLLDSKNDTKAQAWARNVEVDNPVTATIENIPAHLTEDEEYQLYAKGESISGKIHFESLEPIRLDSHTLSLFIQTDKAVYKPGQLARFRVVAVKPDLKPFDGIVDIKIMDPNNNIIQQRLAQPFVKGVVSHELQLSDEPPLGGWRIEALAKNKKGKAIAEKYVKTFDVDKYVLPKFEVKLTVPPFSQIDQDIPVTVTAKYTYDKGVRGIGEIAAEYPWPVYYESENQYKSIIKKITLDEDGSASVKFTADEMKKSNLITEYGYNTIRFRATVVEKLTDIERNATEEIQVFKYVEKVTIKKPSETFKPGLNYSALIVVTAQDDGPLPNITDLNVYITITYSYRYDPEGTKEQTTEKQHVILDKDGTKTISMTPPVDAERLSIQARYKSEESEIYEITSVSASVSPSKTFLQLISKQGKVKAGEMVAFQVATSGTIGASSLTMQVMSRGRVVLSKNIPMESTGVPSFEFKTTTEMAPKSRVIVYAIRRDNDEVVTDAIDFNVDGLFKNKVELKIIPDKVQPYGSDGKKTKVEINVKADPNSYVALLGVDQSVRLLKSGNDITQEMVESEIERYDTTGWSGGWHGARRLKRSVWWGPWGIGGKDASSILKNAGLIVLTDAFVYKECPQPFIYEHHKIQLQAAGIDDSLDVADGADGGFRLSNKMVNAPPSPGNIATGSGYGAQRRPAVKIRKEFPETWIWGDERAREDGSVVYEAEVPDTITSWVASAFAVSEETGLGVAPDPAKLQVFREFFIRLNLPYSVKQGEKLALQVLIFNYGDSDQTATVQLDHNENSGFDFVKKSKDKSGTKDSKYYNMRKIQVRGGGGTESVYFPIVPTKVGDLKLLIKATGQSSQDAVERLLLVEPEGVRVFFNKPLVIDLSKDDKGIFDQSIDISPPDAIKSSIIKGSQRIEFSVIGDIMGPLLSSLENLVRMPYGCGEQNMLGFVPNIVVRRYLEATGNAVKNQKLIDRTTKYMESGYQRELQYKRIDHSFSAFGDNDPHGSTWLTAFVVRSFQEAKEYTFIDDNIVNKSIKFLLSQQKENGEFAENGELHHKAMQGGSGQGGVPLTAYVTLALLKAGVRNSEALSYLEQSLPVITDDPYALAVVTYVLHVAESEKKDEALRLLEAKAIRKDEMTHWEAKVGEEKEGSKPWWYDGPKPVDVEMTSYAILTYVRRNQISEAFPSVRWLVSKRNSLGGFASTQDTVIGISALGAYAEKTHVNDINLSLDVEQSALSTTYTINDQNSVVLQKGELSSITSPINIHATGRGMAFAQISWHYNVPKLAKDKPFDCNQDVRETDSMNEVMVQLCCKYGKDGRSNMAVFELEAPSGYQIDGEKLNEMPAQVKDLQRVETSQGDTKAVVYFNSIGMYPACVNITGQKVFQVAEQKPSQIRVFDYYEPEKAVQLEYVASRTVSLEKQCDNCWQELTDEDVLGTTSSVSRADASSGSSVASIIHAASLVSLTLLAILLLTFSQQTIMILFNLS